MTVKDLFSDQAAEYARYRPGYPESLYTYLIGLCARTDRALDAATGNGQIASRLADSFKRVDAIDISEQQLAHALRKPNIVYTLSRAEQTPYDDGSFDLLTVGQAAHWFTHDLFYPEAKRILRKGGILALFGYQLPKVHPQFDEVLDSFYNETLSGCWDPERELVDNGYATMSFPFEKIPSTEFLSMDYLWNCNAFLGFLSTWSAVARFARVHGYNPVERVSERMREAWGPNELLTVTFPVFLHATRM